MKVIAYTALIILVGFSILWADDLVILESTDRHLTIEFSPQQWDVVEKKIDQTVYVSVRFTADDFETAPGQPMVPCKKATIGIPSDAHIDIQLIEMMPGQKISGKLIPTPDLSPMQEYREDSAIYRGEALFPASLFQIGSSGLIRNQRVVCLKIYPIQFSPRNNEIQLINRIVVRVNFTGGKTASETVGIEPDEYFYQGSLLNYQQARAWRIQSANTRLFKNKFASGDWYKIYIKREGIYRITGKYLADQGIDISTIDPATIKIFNNGGRETPQPLYAPRPDSLIENAIAVFDLNNDGKFAESDYFLFYGAAVQGWNYDPQSKIYSHYIHHYTNDNVYWLTWGDLQKGKRMTLVSLPDEPNLPLQTSFEDHQFLEEEIYNPIDSGIDWYGKPFSSGSSDSENRSFIFNLKGARSQDSTRVKIAVVGTSFGNHQFQFFLNEKYLGETLFSNFSSRYIYIASGQFQRTATNLLVDGNNTLSIRYIPGNSFAKAYLDWIELHFGRNLIANENMLLFYSPKKMGIYRYQVSQFASHDIYLFDITSYYDVRQFNNLQIANGTVTFVDSVNSNVPRRYIALTAQNFQSPIRLQKDVTSSLRTATNQADFLIITHDDFYSQALSLKSLRENCDHLKTEVIKISDIYDEFSGGLFDPVAIRDFIKFTYDHRKPQPRYVLLLGGGDFDYRNIIDPLDRNYIPPFETSEKYQGDSRARDDWYVCVAGEDNFMDLAIGRLPARSIDQAESMIKKIIDYQNAPVYGNWRNTVTFVADDEIGEYTGIIEREHTVETENIAESLPPSFNVQKIYLVEYPPVYTASITGIRKPTAQQAIIDAINQGCLIINYMGHGRHDLWAHEVVLEMNQDLTRINCGKKQAFWIAATCYFGRFDNPAYQSMSEELMLLKDNGAIAVFAAARLVGSAPNAALNKLIYLKLFPSSYYKVRIGDAITQAKNTRGNTENDQKTILFSDPTLFLANPAYYAKIVNVVPDTIKALKLLEVSGEIRRNDVIWQDFDGKISMHAFDSKKSRNYVLGNRDTLKYKLPGNSIFRGTVDVIDGRFNLKFIVPKDITYGGGYGRLSTYFWSDNEDGSGFQDYLPVGGTETNLFDRNGPKIKLRLNGEELYDHGFTNNTPLLTIEISDSLSGVNITGEIGHNITLTLNDQKSIVTEYFNYLNNSYTTGSLNLPLGPLIESTHRIVVKAWDNSNNSSERMAEFTVIEQDKLVIRDVLNYPNPFSGTTEFTFWTNLAGEASIKIFTVNGRLIRRIAQLPMKSGFNNFYWEGLDEDGDLLANGVYLYKIFAKSNLHGKVISSEAIEKLMIMR